MYYEDGDNGDSCMTTYPMTTCECPSCGRKGETDGPRELCNVSDFSGPGNYF